MVPVISDVLALGKPNPRKSGGIAGTTSEEGVRITHDLAVGTSNSRGAIQSSYFTVDMNAAKKVQSSRLCETQHLAVQGQADYGMAN